MNEVTVEIKEVGRLTLLYLYLLPQSLTKILTSKQTPIVGAIKLKF